MKVKNQWEILNESGERPWDITVHVKMTKNYSFLLSQEKDKHLYLF